MMSAPESSQLPSTEPTCSVGIEGGGSMTLCMNGSKLNPLDPFQST